MHAKVLQLAQQVRLKILEMYKKKSTTLTYGSKKTT